MRVKLPPSALLLPGLFSTVVQAETSYSARYQAIPVWPEGGLTAEELDGKYVYLNPDRTEVVLAYPSDLRKNGQGEHEFSGALKIHHFQLNNRTEASIVADINRSGSEKYTYTYSIENADSGRQSVQSIRIVVPEYYSDGAMLSPDGWKGTLSESKINAIRVAIGESAGVFLGAHSTDWNLFNIEPGESLSGFRVRSGLSPGFTLAYLRGGGYLPDLNEDMPRAVLDQVVPILQREHNSQNVIIIGPRYSTDDTRQEVACDYYDGILRMVDSGQLDGKSPAVAEAITVLRHYIENTGAVAGNARPIVFDQKPRAGLEREVLQALEWSLERTQ